MPPECPTCHKSLRATGLRELTCPNEVCPAQHERETHSVGKLQECPPGVASLVGEPFALTRAHALGAKAERERIVALFDEMLDATQPGTKYQPNSDGYNQMVADHDNPDPKYSFLYRDREKLRADFKAAVNA